MTPGPRLPLRQVLGHSKTILVLVGGWIVFREVITSKQAMGMALAVAGMIWYGSETSRAKPKATSKDAKSPKVPETAPLLPKNASPLELKGQA